MTFGTQPVPARIARLELPERAPLLGMSDGDARRAFEMLADDGLNLGHADMERYPPPVWALDAFVSAAREGAPVYTPYRGNAAVLEQVAEQLSLLLGVEVDPQRNLGLTAGTQSGLFCAFSSIVDHGDAVALPDPEYMDTERMLRFCGAQVVRVPLEQLAGRWVLDLDALAERARDGARVLALSHPNNPTGVVYSEQDVRRIAEIACEYDLLVVVDELYARLVYDGQPFHHLVAQPGMAERTITLIGPSKTEQLSAYRVGCVVAPEHLMERIEQVLEISAVRAPAFAQHVLLPWLRDDADYLSTRVNEYQVVRDMTYDCLEQLDCVEVSRSQGTSYMFPSVKAFGRSDLAIAQLLLDQAGVVVTPGCYFGPGGIGSFRLCFAQEECALAQALERIAETLSTAVAGPA